MPGFFCTLFFALYGFLAVGAAQDNSAERLQSTTPLENKQVGYYWRVTPVGDTAQLVTLFCRSCLSSAGHAEDLPLVVVLRDTLGDNNPENDRLTSVWLLSYARTNFAQKLLSAVPFFYWHVGQGSKSANNTAPLFDLTSPQRPVVSEISRDLLQWTMLDPMTTTVRATSRAYRSNQLDHERLHLEEAASYLRQAPVGDDQGSVLTRVQVDTIIARLELRKRLLGGFVDQHRAADLGEESGFEEERIRSRNWELLRQCAERSGLVFEPLNLAGATSRYGMLWFPQGQSPPPAGVSLTPIWKLLNIRDPWQDDRLKSWKGLVSSRQLNATGGLLPISEPGAQQVRLVPLALYSLTYPKMPLLLMDFRDRLHVRRHEMTQRSINEVTAGLIGISHFTNWYYYVAADLYDFVAARHGGATDQASRLDSYSQFRVELALDQQLDPELRREMEQRVASLTVNPLEAAPAREMQLARIQYARLQEEAADPQKLLGRLDRERRSELAYFGESNKARVIQSFLHDVSFGLYTHRAPKNPENLALLDRDRRVQYNLSFLDGLVDAGTQPEVSYDTARIRNSVEELNRLMPGVLAPGLRTHAALTLQKLSVLSRDQVLQSDCLIALSVLNPKAQVGDRAPIGIATSPRTMAWADPVESIK